MYTIQADRSPSIDLSDLVVGVSVQDVNPARAVVVEQAFIETLVGSFNAFLAPVAEERVEVDEDYVVLFRVGA